MPEKIGFLGTGQLPPSLDMNVLAIVAVRLEPDFTGSDDMVEIRCHQTVELGYLQLSPVSSSAFAPLTPGSVPILG